MPHTDFFAEPQDTDNLVRSALGSGLRIVPDFAYQTPDPLFISAWAEFDRVRSHHHFYLVCDDCVRSPFSFTHVRFPDYRIIPRHGGPALSLLFYPPYDRDGIRLIPDGFLSYYATYRNTVTKEQETIPACLRAKYRALANGIKRASHPAGVKRKYWVMPHAYEAIKAGSQLGVKGVFLREDLIK